MIVRKSLLFTALFSAGCAALSAYLNLAGTSSSTVPTQPAWMIELHIGAALFGALLFSRFIIGSPAALNGSSSKSTYAVGMVPRIGAVNFFIPGKNTFFSLKRNAQLLGFIACLMIQFISVQTAPLGGAHPDQSGRPVRMNASKGSLAT